MSIVKPEFTPTSKSVELDKLSKVTGVNKLAQEQIIQFAPNMTVVYGENGTGKTGYSRILMALGFSYDKNKSILSNIFEESGPQTAKIEYKTNGKENTFNWTGKNRNDDLENISVFNNNCVQISLDGSRKLIVSPIGFHLFDLVSSELHSLDILFKEKKKEYPVDISWVENLNTDSPQYKFITSLSKDSTEVKLLELSNFGNEQEKQLEAKVTELSKLNKALLKNQIQSLNYQLNELDNIMGKINHAKTVLNLDAWKQLIELNKSIDTLEKILKKASLKLPKQMGLSFMKPMNLKTF